MRLNQILIYIYIPFYYLTWFGSQPYSPEMYWQDHLKCNILFLCASEMDNGQISRKKRETILHVWCSCMMRNDPCDKYCAGRICQYEDYYITMWIVGKATSIGSVCFFFLYKVMWYFLFSSWVLFISFILSNTNTFQLTIYSCTSVVLQMFLSHIESTSCADFLTEPADRI